MKNPIRPVSKQEQTNRRSFLKGSAAVASAATVGAGLLAKGLPAFAQNQQDGSLTTGDAAILRFFQALETIEADLWRQYAELGGATNQGISPIDLNDQNGNPVPTGLAPLYITGLLQLDGDMPQYIVDNTDDEFSHELWLRAYLLSKGETFVDLNKHFATLPPSKVTGVPQVGRITNLTQLTVDTSWWTRYRSDSKNPDFGDSFDQAIPTLNVGRHTAIPRTDKDLVADASQPSGVSNHTQAIANTAGFHFAFIESGGTSLYPQLSQRVTSVEVLRILVSIGPTEAMHFQTWHDKAGNAPNISDTDTGFPGSSGAFVTFPNLNDPAHTPAQADEFQTNLIMPEPTIFLNRKFPPVSIIRPSAAQGAAMAAFNGLVADGLFNGQTPQFFEVMRELAFAADAATRED